MTAPVTTAMASAAAPLVPHEVANTVSQTQTALDPFAPWALLVVLVLAAWALAAYRRRVLGPARPAAPRTDLARALTAVALLALPWAALVGALQAAPPARWLTQLDTQAAQWAQAVNTPALRRLAVFLSDIGDVLPLAVLTLIVAVWLWRRRQRLLAGAWLLSITANALAIRVLKNLFARARPDTAAEMATSGHSFPSGHAAGALMVFGLLAWVLCDQLDRRWHGLIVGAAALLIAGIAASRVLLGVHYFSDVLGGLLWAGMVLLLTLTIVRQAWRW